MVVPKLRWLLTSSVSHYPVLQQEVVDDNGNKTWVNVPVVTAKEAA